MNGARLSTYESRQIPQFRIDFFLAALAVGFGFLQTPLAANLSNALASALAALAQPALTLVDPSVVRSGAELRSLANGHALLVTEACDGLGIVNVCFSALLAGHTLQKRSTFASFACIGFLSIQFMNLVRILMLFALMPASSSGFSLAHYFIFPLVSVALVAGLLWRFLSPAAPVCRPGITWLCLAAIASIFWYAIAEDVTNFTVLPFANAITQWVPGSPIDSLSRVGERAEIRTLLAVSTNPTRLAVLPTVPSDFALSLPLLVASLFAARPPGLRFIVFGSVFLVLSAVAMTLAAHTTVFEASIQAGVSKIALGSSILAYEPPPSWQRGVIAIAQNTMVHFNLFALPFLPLLLGTGDSQTPKLKPPVQRNAKRKRK